MLERRFRPATLGLILWAALFLTACTAPPAGLHVPGAGGAGSTGHLQITTSFAPLSDAAPPPVVTLSRQGITRRVSMQRTDAGYVAEVTGLPAGDWNLELVVYDEAGDLTHSAETTVRVRGGEFTFVELEVRPLDALFELAVDLEGFPERDRVGRVRITFGGGSTWSLAPAGDRPYTFYGERKLPAGDYEFSVGLYGESFYASDRIYESPWESVRLKAGKRQQVHWQPALGGASVRADIERLPATPAGVRCEVRAGDVWILWQVEPGRPGETMDIYWRSDEFSAPKLVANVDAQQGQWLLGPQSAYASGEAMLARVDARGIKGYRSDPVSLAECALP